MSKHETYRIVMAGEGLAKRLPEWQRTAFVTPDATKHRVLVPAIFTMESELLVIWAATQDGVPMTTWRKHAYVPTDWAREQQPSRVDFWNEIEGKILAHELRSRDHDA